MPPRCSRRRLAERGVKLVKNARAESVARTGDGVLVTLADGRTVEGSHALMTVGSVPNTAGLGLEKVGIELGPGNYLTVDRVSRTSAPGIYAAGDCTGLLPLASVAAMQGRIAMYHALGEGGQPDPAAHRRRGGVHPARRSRPSGCRRPRSTTAPSPARTMMLPLTTNARAKMSLLRRGFVKIFCRPATGVVIGGVVVAPIASELILPIALAVQNDLGGRPGADVVGVPVACRARSSKPARRLMAHDDLD